MAHRRIQMRNCRQANSSGRGRLAAALMAFALAGALPAASLAQTKTAPPATAPAPATPESPPPYENELLRLAEIMGALAFLRDLCGQNDGAEWHKQMAALLEAEGVTRARRARLAGAYNRGFRGFETTYRSCTDHARAVIELYIEEGRALARSTASRFGG